MRSNVPRYDLRTPANLDDVLALLAAEPGRWRPFAGGTDIMVLLEAGRLEHTHYVSLWGVRDLRFIDVTDREVVIGATTTYTDILDSRILRDEFPLLCSAAAETGGPRPSCRSSGATSADWRTDSRASARTLSRGVASPGSDRSRRDRHCRR